MKLLLSSHSLSDKDTKKVRESETVRQRGEKPQTVEERKRHRGGGVMNLEEE